MLIKWLKGLWRSASTGLQILSKTVSWQQYVTHAYKEFGHYNSRFLKYTGIPSWYPIFSLDSTSYCNNVDGISVILYVLGSRPPTRRPIMHRRVPEGSTLVRANILIGQKLSQVTEPTFKTTKLIIINALQLYQNIVSESRKHSNIIRAM